MHESRPTARALRTDEAIAAKDGFGLMINAGHAELALIEKYGCCVVVVDSMEKYEQRSERTDKGPNETKGALKGGQ